MHRATLQRRTKAETKDISFYFSNKYYKLRSGRTTTTTSSKQATRDGQLGYYLSIQHHPPMRDCEMALKRIQKVSVEAW